MNRDRKLIFLTVLYFAILGCFLLGCSEGTDSSPVSALMGNIDSSHSANKISGLVMDSSTNEPMANIYVQLNYYDSNDYKHFVKGELSASDGSFTFSGLDNGTYSVNITKENYDVEQPTNKCFVSNGFAFDNYIIYLKAESNTNINQEVSATIKGIVKRSDNSTAANTPIVLCSDPEATQEIPNLKTLVLGDGSFNLFNVPTGSNGKNYFIRVGEPNSEELTVYPIGIDNKGTVSPSDIVINVNVVNQAETISNIVFKISSAYTGASLELATLKINGENKGTSNINGEVSISKITKGLSNVEITKEGFETLTTSIDFNDDVENPINITMVEDTKDGYGSITGRYVDLNTKDGVGDLIVRLYRLIQRTQKNNDTMTNKTETWFDVDKDYILTTRTSKGTDNTGLKGSFKLTHIEPGYYQIYIGEGTAIPETEQRSQVYPEFLWTQLATDTVGMKKITQPFQVLDNQTTYWTNYEQGN